MFNLSKYLEKFSKNISSNDLNKEEVFNIIFNITKISLKKEDLQIKDGVLYINTTPAKKNFIFIHKQKILDSFSSISVNIKDIR